MCGGEGINYDIMNENSVNAVCLQLMSTANDILGKAKKNHGLYYDTNKVQKACKLAYQAVLLALDEYLKRIQPDKPTPKNFEEYKKRISEHNNTILIHFLFVHDALMVAGVIHGTQSVKTVEAGMGEAFRIIDFLKNIH